MTSDLCLSEFIINLFLHFQQKKNGSLETPRDSISVCLSEFWSINSNCVLRYCIHQNDNRHKKSQPFFDQSQSTTQIWEAPRGFDKPHVSRDDRPNSRVYLQAVHRLIWWELEMGFPWVFQLFFMSNWTICGCSVVKAYILSRKVKGAVRWKNLLFNFDFI